MRLMAESTTSNEQRDIPRAPPPSPEVPHHQFEQFNFAELLSIASLKGSSPSSSTEHSRPDSPLFYHSPEHILPESGSVSPLEQTDSPYNCSSKLSELSLTHIGYQDASINSNSITSNHLLCGSLPVNGDMHSYMNQQDFDYCSDFNHLSNYEQDIGNPGERRRKISLKRQHDNHGEYCNDATSHGGIEIINKKLCHSYVGSAPSHARRSNTFSGTLNSQQRPVVHQNLSLNTGGEFFQVGSLNHLYNNGPSNDARIKTNSECLSPGSLKTVGFSTNRIGITDEQMEGVEMEGENDVTPPSIPISVTQMDWNNGGISLSGNILPTNSSPHISVSGFPFTLPSHSTNYTPPSLSFHLNVPGFSSDSYPISGFLSNQYQEQDSAAIPQITLTPHYFSKSL